MRPSPTPDSNIAIEYNPNYETEDDELEDDESSDDLMDWMPSINRCQDSDDKSSGRKKATNNTQMTFKNAESLIAGSDYTEEQAELTDENDSQGFDATGEHVKDKGPVGSDTGGNEEEMSGNHSHESPASPSQVDTNMMDVLGEEEPIRKAEAHSSRK